MEFSLNEILHPILLSVKTISVAFVLFIIVGIPTACLLSNKKLKLRWLLDAVITMPLVFPPIAVGFFLLMLLGRNSTIGKFLNQFDISFIFSFQGIVLAAFIAGLPLMVKPLQSALEQFPKEIKEASYTCGKSYLYTLIFIILPVIKKSLIASLLIASARGLGEVGVTLILGGNLVGKTDTMSLAIYNAVFDGRYDLALLLSSILAVTSLLFFVLLHFLQKKNEKDLLT